MYVEAQIMLFFKIPRQSLCRYNVLGQVDRTIYVKHKIHALLILTKIAKYQKIALDLRPNASK